MPLPKQSRLVYAFMYSLMPQKLSRHEALLTPVCCRMSANGGTSLQQSWECLNPSTTTYYS